jgi:hypothetical protein
MMMSEARSDTGGKPAAPAKFPPARFESVVTPLVIMVAIPFSLVGILPAHAALDWRFR